MKYYKIIYDSRMNYIRVVDQTPFIRGPEEKCWFHIYYTTTPYCLTAGYIPPNDPKFDRFVSVEELWHYLENNRASVEEITPLEVLVVLGPEAVKED